MSIPVDQIPAMVTKIMSIADRILNIDGKIENLKKKFEELKDARDKVQLDVDLAVKNEEEILGRVHGWIFKVNKRIDEETRKIAEAEENAKKRWLMELFPNYVSLWNLRKEMDKETKVMAELLKEGEFGRVAFVPASEFSFPSRQKTLDEIMSALGDENISRPIGVYGMAGVGKTTLIKEVARQVKESKSFSPVVITDVTKISDTQNIQEDLAAKLGFKFTDNIKTTVLIADRLRQKLKFMNALVILDNVQSGLDLNAIGIPFADNTVPSRILLTSRDPNVLSNKMGVEKNISVSILDEKEAWDLFKKIAGDSVEHISLLPTAKEVVRRCAGLPQAIMTVAEVLKNKSGRDALDQLKRLYSSNLTQGSSSTHFTRIPEQVNSAIELSYHQLESEEHKLTFLLCSLVGEKITVFDLLAYAMGLDLFGAITFEEALAKVETVINQLKSSHLLLKGLVPWQFSIPDVVRDIAMSFQFMGGQMRSMTNDLALQDKLEDNKFSKRCTAISLLDYESNELPEKLSCPKLLFFHISAKASSLMLPDKFFSQTSKLKVLDLTNLNLLSLPTSITKLVNLCTLRLDKCAVKDIAIMGKLKNLEILSLQQSEIEVLPMEITQLRNLRCLNLTKTKVMIPSNLLSSLSKLEQLFLCDSFVDWDTKGGKNASVDELKDLPCLTCLEFQIHDTDIMPKDLFHVRLERFKILIGKEWNSSVLFETGSTLKLKLNSRLLQDRGVKVLLKKAEDVYLNLDDEQLQGVRSLIYELDHDGFPNLKYLTIESGSNIEYIIHCKQWINSKAFPLLDSLFLQNLTNLKKICHGHYLLPESFSRLKIIKARSCEKLKNFFSFSVAAMLFNLEEIEVTDCKDFSEIISEERVESTELVLPLRSLRLDSLPNLICFCTTQNISSPEISNDNETTNQSASPPPFQSRLQSFQKLCFSCICFCCRDDSTETTSTRTVSDQKILFPCKEFKSYHCSIKNLTSLFINDCNSLRYLFSVSIAETLDQLKLLDINHCVMMEAILVMEESEQVNDNVSFPQLDTLKLKYLSKLKGFCSGDLKIKFPSLKQLEIINCPEVEEFIFTSTSTNRISQNTDSGSSLKTLFDEKVTFPSLEKLTISGPKNLTQIFHNQLDPNSFCQLKVMRIRLCEKLSTIFPCNTSALRRFQKLSKLRIYHCKSLEKVFDVQGIPLEETKAEVAIQLTQLFLEKLENLNFVWNKDPRGILTFRNLQLVSARECKKLKHLFRTSIARGLDQLETLEVKDCGVEEIVAKEEGPEEAIEFGFPRLSTLELSNLTKLKCFYPGTYTTDWPALNKLDVSHCKELKIFGSEDTDDETIRRNGQQPLFLFEKVIHQLDQLSLNSEDISIVTAHPQYLSDLFHYIRVLRVSCDDNNSHHFPSILQRFYNLEKLVVDSCTVTKLFLEEENDADNSFLGKFESLEVWQCNGLKCLAPSSVSFQSLTYLDVWKCQGMIHLISPSIARTLVQLTEMRIRECKNLTEIVGSQEDESDDHEIEFPKLKCLKLQYLQNLTSFCQGKMPFNFPAMEDVCLEKITNINSFCKGELIPNKLKILVRFGRGIKQRRTNYDLNALIKTLKEEQEESESKRKMKKQKKKEQKDQVEDEATCASTIIDRAQTHDVSQSITASTSIQNAELKAPERYKDFVVGRPIASQSPTASQSS